MIRRRNKSSVQRQYLGAPTLYVLQRQVKWRGGLGIVEKAPASISVYIDHGALKGLALPTRSHVGEYAISKYLATSPRCPPLRLRPSINVIDIMTKQKATNVEFAGGPGDY